MPEQPASTTEMIETALQQLQAGQFAAAEASLRAILACEPTHADALHFFGVAALQQGRLQEAYDSIQRSLAISQNFAAFNNLGHVLWLARKAEEALQCFDRAARLNPDHPDAYWNMASSLAALGRHAEAVQVLQRLIKVSPSHPRAQYQMGVSLAELNYLERAAVAFQEHLKLAADDVECYGRRSVVLAKLKRFDDAIASAERAVEIGGPRADAHNNLAWVLEQAGRVVDAEKYYRRAIAIDPNFLLALGNLAAVCDRADRCDEALEFFERAAAVDPKHVEAQCAVAGIYNKVGRYQDALAAADRALAIKPHDPAARGHRALALLAFGDYTRGFSEYEWRWQCKDFTTPAREFSQPRYRGGDASGRTVFIHSEQGYGDNIQFARFLPLLAARGAKVVFECPINLRRLMETVPGVAKVVPGGLRPPPFDLEAPLLSLPHAFGISLETVPATVPYFTLPDAHVEGWQAQIAEHRSRLNVGLLWRGNSKPNPKRSISLAELAPLASGDVSFFSLQVGEHAKLRAAPPQGMRLISFADKIVDFYDLAGLIACMDLVITIDSGPAHLAGALGRPTWTMLIKSADWRWLSDRVDSPWYPSMKLYRQSTSDDWTAVVADIGRDLRTFVR